MKESLSRKTFKGFIYMSAGTGTQFILQSILLVVLARLLSPEDFGLISIIMVLIMFCNIFSTATIGPAIIQRKELKVNHISTAFSLSIMLNVVFSLLFLILAPFIGNFFGIENLNALRSMSIIFIFQGLSAVAESLMTRNLRIKIIALIQVISYFLYGITGIILAVLDFGVWALVIANLVQFGSKCVITLAMQPHVKKVTFDISAIKDLLYFGGGFSLARIFNQIALQGDNFITGRFLGVEALGYYSRAYQLMATPVSLLGKVFDIVLFPAMAKVQDNKNKLTEVYLKGINLIALLSIPFSVIIVFFSENIVNILFGSNWAEVTKPFMILAVGIMFRSSYKFSDALIQAKGAVYLRAKRQFVFAILVLFGTWLGHFWGLPGIAYGVLFSLIINYLLMSHLSIKLLSINWFKFIKAQIYGVKIGILTLLMIVIVKELNFGQTLHEIVTLLLTLIFILLLIIISIIIFPKFFLGPDGYKYLKKIISKLNTSRDLKG